jgi:uncharacterized protein (TIGR03435 family)
MKTRLALVTVAAVVLAIAQTTAESAAFEVASIRRHELPPNQFVLRFEGRPGPPQPRSKGNRYATETMTVQDLLTEAYGVYPYQIFELPDWASAMRGEHFDIDARSAGKATPSTPKLRLMLQHLLAERFRLKLHRETRPVPVYVLVVKNAGRMKEITKEQFEGHEVRDGEGPQRYPGTRMTRMFYFAQLLQRRVDRPVIDETKMTGYYEIASPEWMRPNRERPADSVEAQAAVFSELQSRYGLKLEPRKVPFEVLVVDHVERPSPS